METDDGAFMVPPQLLLILLFFFTWVTSSTKTRARLKVGRVGFMNPGLKLSTFHQALELLADKLKEPVLRFCMFKGNEKFLHILI